MRAAQELLPARDSQLLSDEESQKIVDCWMEVGNVSHAGRRPAGCRHCPPGIESSGGSWEKLASQRTMYGLSDVFYIFNLILNGAN